MSIQPPNISMPNRGNRGTFMPRLPGPPPLRTSFDPPPSLPGYFVDSEDDIIVRDVPMDDSISYFPTRDLSKIFIRQWNKQGNLEHLTYVLEQPEPKNLPAPEAPPLMPQQEPSKELTAIADTLSSLNSGLAATFGQFGSVLQSMQQKLDGVEKKIMDIPRFTIDDGGKG